MPILVDWLRFRTSSNLSCRLLRLWARRFKLLQVRIAKAGNPGRLTTTPVTVAKDVDIRISLMACSEAIANFFDMRMNIIHGDPIHCALKFLGILLLFNLGFKN